VAENLYCQVFGETMITTIKAPEEHELFVLVTKTVREGGLTWEQGEELKKMQPDMMKDLYYAWTGQAESETMENGKRYEYLVVRCDCQFLVGLHESFRWL
jgi:hypothetical protein